MEHYFKFYFLINQVKILCPGRKCGKCLRMIQQVERAIQLSGKNTEIEIIDSIDKMMKYRTWILPTLIINEKVTARGYAPPIDRIVDLLF